MLAKLQKKLKKLIDCFVILVPLSRISEVEYGRLANMIREVGLPYL